MKNKLLANELSNQEAHFAKLICQGYTGVDAYRAAFNVSDDAKPNSHYVEASKIKARPRVAQRIKEGLDQARLQDLDSIGRYIADHIDAQERAKLNGDANVEAKLLDQRGKMHGAFRDTRVLVVENHMSDAELIERLSRGDPGRLEAARKLLSVPDGFIEHEMVDVTPDPENAK